MRSVAFYFARGASRVTLVGALFTALGFAAQAQNPTPVRSISHPAHPKLVVMIVVDQMRGDYVDKFRGQWTGGLKRLLEEGAWFREAAYPYAATETCVGHATISTGAFPATHGMIANAWWDRDQQKMVTCTSDPNALNVAYAGGSTKGGDSAVRMQLPSFAEELKFQTGGATRVVTFSLKARAAITLAGHKGDAVTWLDSGTGAWVTSSAYGAMPFVEEFARKHPLSEDYGKTWSLSLPESAYLYDEKATGAAPPGDWSASFPHPLRGKEGSTSADEVFFGQWASSPFADTYLTHMAEAAIDSLGLGKAGGTDYLGVSYSTLDYVGHAYGPRSREIQDVLVHLDKDLGGLLVHLDQKIGRGNYIVALSADHGVAPVPEDMAKTGVDAGVLIIPELQERMEKALEPFNYTKPAIARMAEGNVYFSPGIYARLQQEPAALRAVMDAALTQPGVAAVYRAEDLSGSVSSSSEIRTALTLSYFPSRSGDLFIVPEPYWLVSGSPAGKRGGSGTGHGTPYNYDQHVPLLLLGYGIQPGEYFNAVTPADIAPTFAALCGITLATRDGRVLAEALNTRAFK
ncbi:MAG: alkaline phosphatase family protein [Candidatus Acidiferrales bacterium]